MIYGELSMRAKDMQSIALAWNIFDSRPILYRRNDSLESKAVNRSVKGAEDNSTIGHSDA